jgi:tetratricopeptide (TPR) repeat protein
MYKPFLFLLVFSLSASHPRAQSPDKEKITAFFQNQQFEEAIAYLDPFYLPDSNNTRILGDLGYAHYMNDERQKARFYFLKLLKQDPDNISANQYLANICVSENKMDSAGIYALRLIQLAPARSSYYRFLGNIYKKNDSTDSAIFYYQRAYALSPADPKNILALADVLINKNNYRLADSVLDLAVEKDSLNPGYLKLQIQSAYESKNYNGIISPGEKLIGLWELNIPVLTKLVYAYFTLDRFRDCIRICELMDSNRLAGETTFYYEAKCWAKLNNPVLSNFFLEKCLSYSIAKTSELYYYNLAQNNELLKNYQLAILEYDTAYYLFKYPMMLYHCGRLYDVYLKNPKKAKWYYQKYLRLAHPGDAEEKRLYRVVRARCEALK